MVDCHMHMVLDGMDWKAAIHRHAQGPKEDWVRQILQSYADAGFTWLRDGGDRWGVGALARRLAPEYGITYRTPLSPLCKKGHYGAFIGTVFADLKEYATLVTEQKRKGADFIKIMISGLMDFDRFGVLTEEGLTPSEIKEMIHIVHDQGLSVMAHGNGTANVLAAAEAGVDSIEHGAYLHPEALHAMAEAGTVWVPTLSTIGNLQGKGRFEETAVRAILENALQNVHSFAAMGGLLAPGTDAGAWAVPHAVKSEYELLAGLDLTGGIQTIIEKF